VVIKINNIVFDYFSYNPETGKIIWIKQPNSNRTKIMSEAGGINPAGYRRIMFNKKMIYAHRLAWFLYYKKQPVNQIDHINGNKDDNRINNLREVTNSENQKNRKSHRAGKLVGCSFDKKRLKWRTFVREGNKQKNLGYSDTELQAHIKYLKYYGLEL
jgi:hypothetical protein